MAVSATFAELAQAATANPPRVAVVLGSGLGEVARPLQRDISLPFAVVPGLSAASVVGHRGCLSLGKWSGQRVLLFAGRLHYYEGHTWDQVTQPIRIAYHLGARILLLTNAAGGIGRGLAPGSLLLLRDHIEWTYPFCWRRPGPGGLGPARPSPYSSRLLELLHAAGRQVGLELPEGIYAQLTGPCYETPAEIRALAIWGADAVGMSTAREIQTGFELGMECAGISLITNLAAGLNPGPLHHGEVLTTAARAAEQLGGVIEAFLGQMGQTEGVSTPVAKDGAS